MQIGSGAFIPKILAFAALVAALACLAFFYTPRAWAFTPDTESLATTLAKRSVRPDSWQAVITFPDSGLNVFAWYQEGKWRQEWARGEGEASRVAAAAVGVGEKALAACPGDLSSFPPPLPVLWIPEGAMDKWTAMGVNPDAKSYRFVDERPCLVLGYNATYPGPNQVWLDNETLAPLKLIRANYEGRMEITWTDYTSLRGVNLPGGGSILFPDGRQAPFTIQWKGVDMSLPQTVFQVPAFDKKFANARCETPPPFPLDMMSLHLLPATP